MHPKPKVLPGFHSATTEQQLILLHNIYVNTKVNPKFHFCTVSQKGEYNVNIRTDMHIFCVVLSLGLLMHVSFRHVSFSFVRNHAK